MPGYAKTDSRYWTEGKRLFKDNSQAFSCRFSYRGKRSQIALGLGNKRQAAAKAAEIYKHLIAHGWEPTLRRFKGDSDSGTTVGKFISMAAKHSSARSHTITAYAKAFRKIVSEIENIDPAGRFDSKSGGSDEWKKRIDAVSLARITPEKVTAWKNKRLNEFRDDPQKRDQTIVTINSLIRNAKALFAKKHLPFLRAKLELPEVLPFDGVSMEKSPTLRYHSKINASAILEKAQEQLAGNDDEVFKALLLALVCGLRRSEIDNLLWEKFDFGHQTLRIESTKYHQLKSSDSAGEIDLNQTTAEIFARFHAENPDDQFVIKGPPPRQINGSRDYRCNAVFDRLNNWLRSQGVDSKKPIHTLRKEVGSVIAAQHGIFAASRYLRHANLTITAQLYTDKKQTVVPDFGE